MTRERQHPAFGGGASKEALLAARARAECHSRSTPTHPRSRRKRQQSTRLPDRPAHPWNSAGKTRRGPQQEIRTRHLN